MKLLSLATVRTGNELEDPIICCMSSELSSFGFFQRPVSKSCKQVRLDGELQTRSGIAIAMKSNRFETFGCRLKVYFKSVVKMENNPRLTI